MKPARLLLFVCIGVLPLDTADFAGVFIGKLHVGLVDLLLSAAVYVTLLGVLLQRKVPPFLRTTIFACFALAVVCSCVNFAYIPKYHESYDVKVTLNLVEYASLFLVASRSMDDERTAKSVLYVFSLGALAVAGLTILKSLGAPLPGYVRVTQFRTGPFFIGAVGGVDNVMEPALLALGAVPVFLLRFSRARITSTVAISSLVLAVFIYFSRTAWMALALELWLFAFFKFSFHRKKLLKAGLLVASAITALEYISRVYAFVDNLRPTTVQQRFSSFQLVLHSLAAHPLDLFFGIGKGAFITRYGGYSGTDSVVHNFALDLLASKGLFVMVAVLLIPGLILVQLARILRRQESSEEIRGLATAFLLGLAGMLAEGMFAPITNSIVFWAYAALAFAFVLGQRRPARRRSARANGGTAETSTMIAEPVPGGEIATARDRPAAGAGLVGGSA